MRLTESMLRKIIKEEIQKTNESPLKKPSIPGNILAFAKKKGPWAVTLLKKAASWAHKSGKTISGGTAIGKNYRTLVLDVTHNGGEIRIDLEDETIKLHGEIVNSPKEFAAVLSKKNVNESRSRVYDIDSVVKETFGVIVDKYGGKIYDVPAGQIENEIIMHLEDMGLADVKLYRALEEVQDELERIFKISF
jgi:hypothetical protein